MELQITGKNVKLIPSARGYIERKLDKLNRHLPHIIECKVEISEEKTRSPEQRFVAQVTVDSSGTLLRGEERGDDLFTAIDRVVAVMDRQIERYKGKLYDKGRGNSFARSEFKSETGIDESEQKIAKVKRFSVNSMTAVDAIEQMELLGHDFFLFFNADTDRLNLLYRRKEGDYGLIEPVFE
jgi:putative sigma-54 modulation protein